MRSYFAGAKGADLKHAISPMAARAGSRLATDSSSKMHAADPKEHKRLRQEQRTAEAAIVRAHEPEDFGAWLHRRNERDQAILEQLEALFKQRDGRKVDRQRQVENKAPVPAHMQSGNRSVANPQYREDQDLRLAMQVRQELRDLGVRDDKLPSHAEISAQFDDLRTRIRREASERRRSGPTKSEAKLMAEILYTRGRSQSRGMRM
jgi:hypothetical protein